MASIPFLGMKGTVGLSAKAESDSHNLKVVSSNLPPATISALFTHDSAFHIYFLGANRGQVSRVHFHFLSALNSTNAASYAG
jgi:hypothetical protein